MVNRRMWLAVSIAFSLRTGSCNIDVRAGAICPLTSGCQYDADRAVTVQGNAVRQAAVESAAAPATVSGKRLALIATGAGIWRWEGWQECVGAVSQETCRHRSPILRAGCTGERKTGVASDVQP